MHLRTLFMTLSITLILAACSGGSKVDNPNSSAAPAPSAVIKACTKEAKICPDGSSVGRNAEKNCEFDACPSTEVRMCTMEAKQCPDGSFVSRNSANNCAFDPCPGEKK